MICSEIFWNHSIKPVRMKRNMAVKNTHFKGKSIKFFTGNWTASTSRKGCRNNSNINKSKKVPTASYLVTKAKHSRVPEHHAGSRHACGFVGEYSVSQSLDSLKQLSWASLLS
jgi:hypothetical protein